MIPWTCRLGTTRKVSSTLGIIDSTKDQRRAVTKVRTKMLVLAPTVVKWVIE